MSGYGTYNQPPGTWSDDTSLTLCLIENLIKEESISILMDKFIKYKKEGHWTQLGKMFDIGRTTNDAIIRFEEGYSPEKCGGKAEFDNGNGAIMRIAPLAFILLYNEFDFVKEVEMIKRYTEITHAHPRAIVGSIIYIECLIRLYHINDEIQGIEASLAEKIGNASSGVSKEISRVKGTSEAGKKTESIVKNLNKDQLKIIEDIREWMRVVV
ncbi:ADP-ribosylglycohydrolase family protein [Bacillus pseudomycoides]|uniref:ADP-ribosylglycohydrolase family protein n=2 Tax=Bacillus pseudomycoides TaxID=64104 RepID=UPI00352A91D5